MVFGQVVNGLDVLSAMESEGAQSGETKSVVKIKNCGLV